MYWAIFGIFHSIFRAAYAEINRIYNVDRWQIAFMQSLCGIVIMLPFVPFMVWPDSPNFYLAALLVALIIAVGMVVQLNLNSIRKGRTSSVSISIEAVAALLIWTAITPYALENYLAHPFTTLCVVAGFFLAIMALFMVRRPDLSWESLLVVAPIGITFAVAGVVTKLVIPVDQGMAIPACLSFVLLNYMIMVAVLGAFLIVKRKAGPVMLEKNMVKAGLLTGICAVLASLSFVVSVVYAPNPGYTSLLVALVPVWLMWYHEMRYIEDKANPVAGLMIVAAVVLLVIATWS